MHYLPLKEKERERTPDKCCHRGTFLLRNDRIFVQHCTVGGATPFPSFRCRIPGIMMEHKMEFHRFEFHLTHLAQASRSVLLGPIIWINAGSCELKFNANMIYPIVQCKTVLTSKMQAIILQKKVLRLRGTYCTLNSASLHNAYILWERFPSIFVSFQTPAHIPTTHTFQFT